MKVVHGAVTVTNFERVCLSNSLDKVVFSALSHLRYVLQLWQQGCNGGR